MAERARSDINSLFRTSLEAKTFDYLASNLKASTIVEVKNYLGAPLEDTYKALMHLEDKGLAKVQRNGMLLQSKTSIIVTTTPAAIRKYKALKSAFS